MPSVSWTTNGLEEAFTKAEAHVRGERGLSGKLRELIEDAGREGKETMLLHVPGSGFGGSGTIAGSIRSTQAVFHPGGAGGGGFYEVHVGPDPATAPEHTRYVMEGTGIHNEKTGMWIRAHNPWQAMPVSPEPNLRIRMSHPGQKPNRYWYDAGCRKAREHIATHLQRLNT